MAEGFGQYVGKIPPRMAELRKKIKKSGSSDPEDLMIEIMEVSKRRSIISRTRKVLYISL